MQRRIELLFSVSYSKDLFVVGQEASRGEGNFVAGSPSNIISMASGVIEEQ